MPQHDRSQIAELAHLYVDGAFDRRELLRRVAFVTGSLAAATMALESVGLPAPATDPECDPCPADVRVPEDAADLEVLHQVQFPAGRLGPALSPSALTCSRASAARQTTRKRPSGCISKPPRLAGSRTCSAPWTICTPWAASRATN
jgi:hypothetical protein